MTNPYKLGDVIQEDTREDGFTILELLTVIFIIGILAAVAIPVFTVQRKKAADASIRSDLQSVAQTYIGWQATGKNNKDFWAVSKVGGISQTSMVVTDPNYPTTLPAENWNIAVPDYQVKVSKGNTIELVVRATNREGAFCLVATSPRSQWNYVPGSAMQIDYNKALYFDMEAGGVKTMAELVTLRSSGALLACDNYVQVYQAAGGS